MAVIEVKGFVTAVFIRYTSIRQTPIFPKDIDMKMKLWYNLRRFLYEIKDISIFKKSYIHIT